MNAYLSVLYVHSWLRWAVLAVAVVMLARTAAGWLLSRTWQRGDERLQVAFVVLMDLQLLLGLGLYLALSPITRAFLASPAESMRVSAVRFFGVEHVALMLIAVGVAHAGRVVARQAPTARSRYARACVATALVLAVVLLAIPWPALRYGRPLFRTANPDAGAALSAAYIMR